MPCLRAHLLPGRQGMEPSSLQEGQCQLLAHHSIQPESCVAPSARKAPLSPRVGDEHLASISSWLGSSSQHLLSRSIPTPAISSSTTRLCQYNFPQYAPTHSRVHSSVGCPTMQMVKALALKLEFRPGQRLQVTQLSDTAAIGPSAFKLAAKVRAALRERTWGGAQAAEPPSTTGLC